MVQVLVVELLIQGVSGEISRIMITAVTHMKQPISNAKESQIVSEPTTKQEVAQSLVENENININCGSGLNLKNYRVSVVLLVIPYIYSYSIYLSFIIYSKQINYQLPTFIFIDVSFVSSLNTLHPYIFIHMTYDKVEVNDDYSFCVIMN